MEPSRWANAEMKWYVHKWLQTLMNVALLATSGLYARTFDQMGQCAAKRSGDWAFLVAKVRTGGHERKLVLRIHCCLSQPGELDASGARRPRYGGTLS